MDTPIIRYDEFDFKNSTVIKPPTSNMDANNRKTTVVIIDSRDRDVTQYPSPSDYVVELNEDLQDLISAELVVASVPFKSYIVNQANNLLHVCVDSVKQVVNVEPANYNAPVLASTLQNQLNRIFAGFATFIISYDDMYDKYTIECDQPFEMKFKDDNKVAYTPKSIGKLLGFDCKNYEVNTPVGSSYKITAPFRKNFEDANFVIMNIDSFNVNNSVNSIVNRSFAIIPEQRHTLNLITSTHRVVKNFNPPISRMAKVRVRFTDFYGNLYDFQNHDHRLEIVFESYKQIRKYQSYFDN